MALLPAVVSRSLSGPGPAGCRARGSAGRQRPLPAAAPPGLEARQRFGDVQRAGINIIRKRCRGQEPLNSSFFSLQLLSYASLSVEGSYTASVGLFFPL